MVRISKMNPFQFLTRSTYLKAYHNLQLGSYIKQQLLPCILYHTCLRSIIWTLNRIMFSCQCSITHKDFSNPNFSTVPTLTETFQCLSKVSPHYSKFCKCQPQHCSKTRANTKHICWRRIGI